MWKPGRASSERPVRKAAAEALADSLPALVLAAEHLAGNLDVGLHGRRRAGMGEDFWQFKPYGQDDPASQIDWRQSAKRDQLFIRQKELESAETVWIWPDLSATMDYASAPDDETKGERAAILGLAVALLLSKGGEKFGLPGQGSKAATGSATFNKFAERLIAPAPPAFTDLAFDQWMSGKSTFLLISDFLQPIEDIRRIVRGFVDAGCRGFLLQIADPAEVELPFKGRTRFEGMQAEGTLTLGRVEAVRDEYQEAFKNHRGEVAALAKALDWDYGFHRTDAPASAALSEIHAALGLKRT